MIADHTCFNNTAILKRVVFIDWSIIDLWLLAKNVSLLIKDCKLQRVHNSLKAVVQRYSAKRGILRNFAIFTGKTCA